MRFSIKIPIASALIVAVLCIFAMMSYSAMQRILAFEERRALVNQLADEISSAVAGQRLIQESFIPERHVLQSLDRSEGYIVTMGRDAGLGTDERVNEVKATLDEFRAVYKRLAGGKEQLEQRNSRLRNTVVQYIDQSRGVNLLLAREKDLGAGPERRQAMERFLFLNAQQWGWLNRAISVVDRDLLIDRDFQRFFYNYKIAREHFQAIEAEMRTLAPVIDLKPVDRFVERSAKLSENLKNLTADIWERSKLERDDVRQLELHGARLNALTTDMASWIAAEAEAHSAGLRRGFWMAVCILLLGTAALTLWISISMTRPLARLARHFKAVSAGNFDHKVPVRGNSEFDELAVAFNEMTERLRQSYAEVEKKVRERTRELERATRSARLLADEAQTANTAKSSFLATMSHEIRTPLNSIIGFSEMLEEGPLTDEQRSDLQIIRRSGRLLLDLINDILDLSKIESGKLGLDISEMRLGDLLHEVTSLFAHHADQKNVRMVVEIADNLPETVTTDRTRVQQVISNLLSNALKFTESGEVRIRAWCEESADAPERRYYVAVSDTGIGIAADKQDEVFEAFTQEDSSTTRKYGGTGLGLAISRRIVELLGGEIRLQSRPGYGSTFSFYFVDQGTLLGELRAVKDQASAASIKVDPAVRILLVEDDHNNRVLAQRFLSAFNLKCDWVPDGRACVEKLSTESYDLVLMDLEMPEMDGLDASRHIRRASGDSHHPYILALTANVLGESRIAAEEAGMNDYITKPVTRDSIRSALERFFATRARRMQHDNA